MNIPLDVIWDVLSVAKYAPAFNDEGIDKATSVIREINKAAIFALHLLEGGCVIRALKERKTIYLDKCKNAQSNFGR